MQSDDEIPFDVPHHWQVFQMTPPAGIEADPGTRLGFFRIQRNDGEALTAPMFVDVAKGEQAQAKIVYGETPLAYVENPTEQERAALLEAFKQTAEELNDDERDGGLYDQEEARGRAAAIIGQRLALLGIRNDWKR